LDCGEYEVLLCAGDYKPAAGTAKVVLSYAGHELRYDAEQEVAVSPNSAEAAVSYRGVRLPLYGPSVRFGESHADEAKGNHAGTYFRWSGDQLLVRLGYDLFEEVRYLLESGQPIAEAATPTLDLHIAILRDLIVRHGAMLVEIPPVPAGYECIACLTHDVDHPTIRVHRFDHTMFGFLYRATIGSLRRVFERRLSWRGVFRNWIAALKLPLVHLGIAEDFWLKLDEYRVLERGAPSTFFVIPFPGRPGRLGDGTAPSYRASHYGVADLSPTFEKLRDSGCEIAVHGIDAWHDSSSGREELGEVQRTAQTRDVGIRMHWLYFDGASPEVLEEAGFDYDSTFGYNETVGYRAGTAQAYRPLSVRHLLELPLHVMDTSLFYPRHLDLDPEQARTRIQEIVDNAARLGGCVTVNWHDRSIMPERLWGDLYGDLVNELQSRGAWFATAAQTVSWFRQRRSVVLEGMRWQAGGFSVNCNTGLRQDLPPLQVRIHNAPGSPATVAVGAMTPDAVVSSN
jgi:peptidoglycan/xylan/chitin deacetylase (PgdA/CDA1 family)